MMVASSSVEVTISAKLMNHLQPRVLLGLRMDATYFRYGNSATNYLQNACGRSNGRCWECYQDVCQRWLLILCVRMQCY